MKKIFTFICITLMCISLNSCTVYAMSDEYDRTCYHTHNVYRTTPKQRYYNCKPDRNNSNYKPITYRYYTVPIYDPNKPIKPHLHYHQKHQPKPTPDPRSHRSNHSKHHQKHKYNRR